MRVRTWLGRFAECVLALSLAGLDSCSEADSQPVQQDFALFATSSPVLREHVAASQSRSPSAIAGR